MIERIEALCPYYRKEISANSCQAIICEGVNGAKAVRIEFRNRKKRESYAAYFCCAEFQECAIARAILESNEE